MEGEWLITIRTLVWCESAIRTAAALGAEAGYRGPWLVALGLNRIGGLADSSYRQRLDLTPQLWPRSDDPYADGTETFTTEMLAQPHEVLMRITRKLLRGLGSSKFHANFFQR